MLEREKGRQPNPKATYPKDGEKYRIFTPRMDPKPGDLLWVRIHGIETLCRVGSAGALVIPASRDEVRRLVRAGIDEQLRNPDYGTIVQGPIELIDTEGQPKEKVYNAPREWE